MTDSSIDKLSTFIVAAEKSRKYSSSTATNLRYSLKLIEKSLNDEELVSVEKLESNLNNIFHDYYNKNQDSVSAASLETYKSRVRKLVKDFAQYGANPTKMANWNPLLRARKPKQKKEEASSEEIKKSEVFIGQNAGVSPPSVGDVLKFELPVSTDELYAIYTPSLARLKKKYLGKLKKYVEYLETIVDDEE